MKDKKIKNIIISTHDPLYPIRGGGAIRTLNVATAFKKRGHNVIIIAPTEGVGNLNGIKVHWLHAPRKQRSQILSSLKFNIRLLRKFLQFVRNTDMFYVRNTIAAATLPFLKKIFRFRFVLDMGDVHTEYLHAGEKNIIEKILTPLLLKFEYYIVNSADLIIVVTDAFRELLISKGINSNKIKVVYDGTNTEEFSSSKQSRADNGVIHLGSIDKQHNVELIIKAMPMVIRQYPKVVFYFIGGGRQLPVVKKLTRDLGVMNNCVFTDYLPCEEARKYLEKAYIGLIPRKNNLCNHIATTLKIYEYWASKTAVISSPLKGIMEIARDKRDVLFFESENAQDLAIKILTLLKNEKLRIELIENAFKTIQNFQWKDLISKMVDFSLT